MEVPKEEKTNWARYSDRLPSWKLAATEPVRLTGPSFFASSALVLSIHHRSLKMSALYHTAERYSIICESNTRYVRLLGERTVSPKMLCCNRAGYSACRPYSRFIRQSIFPIAHHQCISICIAPLDAGGPLTFETFWDKNHSS